MKNLAVAVQKWKKFRAKLQNLALNWFLIHLILHGICFLFYFYTRQLLNFSLALNKHKQCIIGWNLDLEEFEEWYFSGVMSERFTYKDLPDLSNDSRMNNDIVWKVQVWFFNSELCICLIHIIWLINQNSWRYNYYFWETFYVYFNKFYNLTDHKICMINGQNS